MAPTMSPLQIKDGSSVIVYMPTARRIRVDLSQIVSKQTKAWWFDPAFGNTSLIGDFSTSTFADFQTPSRRRLGFDTR